MTIFDATPLDLMAASALLAGCVCVGVASVAAVSRYRRSDRHFRRDLLERPGFAKRAEVKTHLSSRALLARSQTLRPALANPKVGDLGWKIGTSRGVGLYVSVEDSLLLTGAPRSGKGLRVVIPAILDWPGPLVTTSTRNDNLTATRLQRAKYGEVTIFDPQRLTGIRSTLRISPVTGCEDPHVAQSRGSAIIAGSAIGKSSKNGEWADAAANILSCLLHAAALSGRGVEAIRDWGVNPSTARPAVDILDRDGAPGWASSLAAVVDSHDEKLKGNKWFGVEAAVRPLAIPSILEALNGKPGEEFDAHSFLDGQDTIYLIGTGAGTGAVGGYLGAVLDDVVTVARKKANTSAGGRLDPPLGLVLDELANMFAWPELPRILSDGGGSGISTLVVLQSLSQATTSWSAAEADTIWNSAIVKLMLGGSSDTRHLKEISDMLGTRETRVRTDTNGKGGRSSQTQKRVEPMMAVDELRRLPFGMGLLLHRNRRGVILDVAPWYERANARNFSAERS
jgi:type IV secretion system protein VirD4